MRNQALDLIGATEAAEILHVDRSVITRWVQLDRLKPANKMRGKTGAYQFHRKDIEALKPSDGDGAA